MKLSNERWVELINEKTEEIQQACLTAFKESLLTEYNPFYMTTDVILHQDGEIYTIDHTGNSTDPDVFSGKAKVIYSVTESNILDDLSEEHDYVEELLNDNESKELYRRWAEKEFNNNEMLDDYDLGEYLTWSRLKEYVDSGSALPGVESDYEDGIDNIKDNLIERAEMEIDNKIEMAIWELENYQ